MRNENFLYNGKFFLLECVTKSNLQRIRVRKKKQSRKGQAESTATETINTETLKKSKGD